MFMKKAIHAGLLPTRPFASLSEESESDLIPLMESDRVTAGEGAEPLPHQGEDSDGGERLAGRRGPRGRGLVDYRAVARPFPARPFASLSEESESDLIPLMESDRVTLVRGKIEMVVRARSLETPLWSQFLGLQGGVPTPPCQTLRFRSGGSARPPP
jgi:hypothetical protein